MFGAAIHRRINYLASFFCHRHINRQARPSVQEKQWYYHLPSKREAMQVLLFPGRKQRALGAVCAA